MFWHDAGGKVYILHDFLLLIAYVRGLSQSDFLPMLSTLCNFDKQPLFDILGGVWRKTGTRRGSGREWAFRSFHKNHYSVRWIIDNSERYYIIKVNKILQKEVKKNRMAINKIERVDKWTKGYTKKILSYMEKPT